MDLKELKRLLKVKTNREVADICKVGETAISNWGKTGVPERIVKMVESGAFGIIGDNNHTVIERCCTSKEGVMLCEILEQWDEKKRKRLLRLALEMDEEG